MTDEDVTEDEIYGTEEEDDDEDDDDPVDTDVVYPEIGATYVVEVVTAEKKRQTSDRYPDPGQQIISCLFVIKEDEEWENYRLPVTWFLGSEDDPNNIAREDLNQCFFALTGVRAGKGTPVVPKKMRRRMCTVQIADGEYIDKNDGETKGSGIRPKLKSWRPYEVEG
jgi:hypothetical protein